MNPTNTTALELTAITGPLPLALLVERLHLVMEEAKQLRTTLSESIKMLRATIDHGWVSNFGHSPDPI